MGYVDSVINTSVSPSAVAGSVVGSSCSKFRRFMETVLMTLVRFVDFASVAGTMTKFLLKFYITDGSSLAGEGIS